MSTKKVQNSLKKNTNGFSVKKANSAKKTGHLNETICGARGFPVENPGSSKSEFKGNETICGDQPKLKAPVTSSVVQFQILETELNLAYNQYLQSYLKQEILEKQVKQQEKILDGQILLQEDNVRKRKADLHQIQSETGLLKKKEEIVKMINDLEDSINKIKLHYRNFQVQKHVEIIHDSLNDISGTLILKNIASLDNKDEQVNLVESVKKLTLASEKIVKSGRNFEDVHKLAGECRNLIQLIHDIKETESTLSAREKYAAMTILQKLSDGFAKQYE